ncbi:MAG TPA: RodZ domain-containing protein [Gaiellaceae bacterium]|nr:RodZ domain-containing protein [Gaiellaceae bacterium]
MFAIGDSLREARVRRGLGYPEVELATKIRARYIRALEEEEFSSLPGDTYIRGFLRTYADYLGLDGQLYADEYASRFGTSWRDEPPQPRSRPRVRRERGLERRAVVLALGGIAVLTALVFVAWKFGGVDSSSSTPSVVRTTGHATAPDQLTLRGVAGGTYVEVRKGSRRGRVLFQGTLAGGTVETLPGSQFYLLVRRPTGLRLTLGGKVVSLPGHENLRVVVTPHWTTRVSG